MDARLALLGALLVVLSGCISTTPGGPTGPSANGTQDDAPAEKTSSNASTKAPEPPAKKTPTATKADPPLVSPEAAPSECGPRATRPLPASCAPTTSNPPPATSRAPASALPTASPLPGLRVTPDPFPAGDESLCWLPLQCPGWWSLYSDPWTGAHNDTQLARAAGHLLDVHARGQRAWTYLGLGHVEGNALEEFPSLANGTWWLLNGTAREPRGFAYHIFRPAFADYIVETAERRVRAGFDGVMVDEGIVTPYSFDPWTLAEFRAWLPTKYTASELSAMGVSDAAAFNYSRHASEVLGHDDAFYGSLEDAPTHEIDKAWFRFGAEKVAAFQARLTAAVKAVGKEQGREVQITFNRGTSDYAWTLKDSGDVLGGEVSFATPQWEYPRMRFATYFRYGAAFDKLVWSWNHPHGTIRDGKATDLVGLYVAENGAAGGLYQSGNTPWGPDRSTHAEAWQLWNASRPYLDFRERTRTYQSPESDADVLVLDLLGPKNAPMNGVVDRQMTTHAMGALLADLQVTYDVSGWADGTSAQLYQTTPWVDAAFLRRYDWVVLAEPELLSEAQKTLLRAFAADGGHVVVVDWDVENPIGSASANVHVVRNVKIDEYMRNLSIRSEHRSAFLSSASGIPRDVTGLAPDVATVRGVLDDGSRVVHFLNYRWNSEDSRIPETETKTVRVALPAALAGTSGDVTWFTPEGGRVLLATVPSFGSEVEVTIPAFHVWGILVAGSPAPLDSPRKAAPVAELGESGIRQYWQDERHEITIRTIAGTSALKNVTFWVTTDDVQWSPVKTFPISGTFARVDYRWVRPMDGIFRLGVQACDVDGACQPFEPWSANGTGRPEALRPALRSLLSRAFDSVAPSGGDVVEVHGVTSNVAQTKVRAPEFLVTVTDALSGAGSVRVFAETGPGGRTEVACIREDDAFRCANLPGVTGATGSATYSLELRDRAGNFLEKRFTLRYGP